MASTLDNDISAREGRVLAAGLVDVLIQACDRRLTDIAWFKADWQRGGAATATAVYRDDSGDLPVVVKFPVVQRELFWTRRLQTDDPDQVVPRLYASGETIGGYDLAWIVIERFPEGPLGMHWADDHVKRLASAAARFQAAAASFEADQPARREDWAAQVAEARCNLDINDIADKKRWGKSLRKLESGLDELVQQWRQRDISGWIHGDLHFANAMCRAAGSDAPVCLIDLAEVRSGHWIEDAVYLERQLWARPERLHGVKPVKALAEARKKLGLPVDPGDTRLAMIRRALLAGTALKYLRSEGHPDHLAACLSRLEAALAELK